MSTRCIIAIALNNHYESIICYNQGHDFSGGAGPTLRRLYTTSQKVKALIDLGDLSTIAPLKPLHRKNQESWTKAKPSKVRSQHDLITRAATHGAELIYLYIRGQWHTIDTTQEGERPKARIHPFCRQRY